jgi:hypothetical protein
MSSDDFEYDVAFSFVKEDEPLATELNDLLQERLKSFLYSKRQESLAGTDGEQMFNDVFGKKARIVVVLYRDTWGTTPWTRIEETAIRNRGFDEGYDFTVFIPVSQGVSLPKWVPKNRLYVGLDRWGAKGAASVIEARVQDAGGTPRVESTVERAQRLKRQIDAESERRKFLASIEGVNAAQAETGRLFDELAQKVTQIGQETGWDIAVTRNKNWIELCGGQGCMALDWRGQYSNTLDGSFLTIGIWEGTPPRAGRHYFRGDEPACRISDKLAFDRDYSGAFVWHSNSSERIPAHQMADHCLKLLMDFTHKKHMENKR